MRTNPRCPGARRDIPLSKPLQELYERIAFTSEHHERKHLLHQAKLLRHQWIDRHLQAEFNERIGRGVAPNQTTKLKQICSVILTYASGSRKGVVSYNREDWLLELREEYDKRWKTRDLQRQAFVRDMLASIEGASCSVDYNDVARAVNNIKLSKRPDSDGLCIKALYLVFLRAPYTLIDALNMLLASSEEMRNQTIVGAVKGKVSSSTTPGDTRSILPMPALLEILDFILARRVISIVEEHFGTVPGVFVGAKRGTQVTEAVGGIVLAIEKGLDSKGCIALADYDIQTFYDTIDPLLLARWWIARRLPADLLSAVLKTVLLPKPVLKAPGVAVKLQPRTRGLHTGSRLGLQQHWDRFQYETLWLSPTTISCGTASTHLLRCCCSRRGSTTSRPSDPLLRTRSKH